MLHLLLPLPSQKGKWTVSKGAVKTKNDIAKEQWRSGGAGHDGKRVPAEETFKLEVR